jgi:hypothetical protein
MEGGTPVRPTRQSEEEAYTPLFTHHTHHDEDDEGTDDDAPYTPLSTQRARESIGSFRRARLGPLSEGGIEGSVAGEQPFGPLSELLVSVRVLGFDDTSQVVSFSLQVRSRSLPVPARTAPCVSMDCLSSGWLCALLGPSIATCAPGCLCLPARGLFRA